MPERILLQVGETGKWHTLIGGERLAFGNVACSQKGGGATTPLPTQKGKEIVACRGGEAAPARHNFSLKGLLIGRQTGSNQDRTRMLQSAQFPNIPGVEKSGLAVEGVVLPEAKVQGEASCLPDDAIPRALSQ